MTNLRSLLIEASQWISDHEPELPHPSYFTLLARIDAALDAGEPVATAEPPAEPHWPLIDTALQGAANALPVLFTMLTKVGLREGAMVADEINGNVLCAIKQLAHVRRPALNREGKS